MPQRAGMSSNKTMLVILPWSVALYERKMTDDLQLVLKQKQYILN